MTTIPHLHIDRHGLALWDDVPVGEYRIVTIHEGPAKGKDVLLQKRADGTAAVHLHPESVEKSFRLVFNEPLKKAIGSVRPDEMPEPDMPTQIAHTLDMQGHHRYIPMHSRELHPDGYPIGAKLPAGNIRTRNGYIHSLPMGERENAENGHGKYNRYKSLGLRSADDRQGIGDHPTGHHDYRKFQDMSRGDAEKHIDEVVHQNGGHNGAIPSPTGDWYHVHGKGGHINFGSDHNGERKDVIPHIPSLLMNPAEVWEHNGDETGGVKTRTHFLYPKPEGDENRFPYGIRLHAHASHLAKDKNEPNHWSVSRIEVPTKEDANEHREGRPVYVQKKHGDE
jgi:hypothetical protein